MLSSLAIIFLLGLLLGAIFNKLKLPSLLGMIITGIIISPFALNLIDQSILMIAADLRRIALVIILTRAGLTLDITDLKRVGRPAILMCFVPACFEIAGVIVIGTKVLSMSVLDAAIMGSVIAAVSPAVVVPRMIQLIEKGYGKKHSIPQLIMAGASVDDVFVIVIFTALTSLATGKEVSAMNFIQIPISIFVGICAGIVAGLLLVKFFKFIHIRDSVKVIIILSVSFLLLECETRLEGVVPMSGLLAIMSMGITIYQSYRVLAKRLSSKYNKLWVAAEILLFVLVGATLDLNYAMKSGMFAVIVVIGALILRMLGVFVCLIKTSLKMKERIFCMVAYTPKATVQAAIGGIPLALGLACGQQVLTVAVVSILITAPFGAIFMDKNYKRLLEKDERER
ncbi:cation:proton antiporter [Candidatus Galacturonibacter soehngenii]|uniref:Sodium:proton antiporter n=1 Tax=Candidatus Galacturonatibacter soehngenii TaxID=2307010 RepID=A0A7V7QP10_9FIRM|nr:cation:proton antiporter [Candidatus Galacturonibacter soehngenii]KAB1440703.1 sodium:proton antiporter [Candidatus Galacturonibacter soehngenii]